VPRAYITPETPEGGAGLAQRVRDMERDLRNREPVESHDLIFDLARGLLKASRTSIPKHQERDRKRIIDRAKPRIKGRSSVDPSRLLTFYTVLLDENDRDLAEMLAHALEENELGGLRVLVSDPQDHDRQEEDEIEFELEQIRTVYAHLEGKKP
jgi:hypothetical protein